LEDGATCITSAVSTAAWRETVASWK